MTVFEDLERDFRLGGLTVWGTYDTGRPGPFIETDAFDNAYTDGERYGTPDGPWRPGLMLVITPTSCVATEHGLEHDGWLVEVAQALQDALSADLGRPWPVVLDPPDRLLPLEPRMVDGEGAWVCGDEVVCLIGRLREHELF